MAKSKVVDWGGWEGSAGSRVRYKYDRCVCEGAWMKSGFVVRDWEMAELPLSLLISYSLVAAPRLLPVPIFPFKYKRASKKRGCKLLLRSYTMIVLGTTYLSTFNNPAKKITIYMLAYLASQCQPARSDARLWTRASSVRAWLATSLPTRVFHFFRENLWRPTLIVIVKFCNIHKHIYWVSVNY